MLTLETMTRVAIADHVLDSSERELLSRFKVSHNISDEEFRATLEKHGWSVEEFKAGVKKNNKAWWEYIY